ncbi:carboxylesterase family protein [Rhizorhabdus wittichii]|uniref:Carboxylic ester hydrolase n=1 Tax=Rhizorhabdus wittichii TaxID=160791 RepID=A0A975D3B2_9SPHN|nr:carboxylesterase family protein [Rhizorhabdus wittichii]
MRRRPGLDTASRCFRGIRYATADRFQPAELLGFEGLDGDRGRGPVSPQDPSRLDMIMGPAAQLAQSEHCQVLSVFTPSLDGRRPVMVWLHGGAFVSGGGELPWYDAARLSAEQDVVVVTVTYRLGAFGFLQFADTAGPSPGTSDQVAALQWVHRHIGQFGGDPDNVTLFGHSAGGASIEAILQWGHASLVRRAILQSGNARTHRRTREEADKVAQMFVGLAGTDPRLLAEDEILPIQRELSRGRHFAFDWWPTSPDVPAEFAVDLMAGWTRDDGLPFLMLADQARPGPDTLSSYSDRIGPANAMFSVGSHAAAQAAVAAGRRAWLYRFDWEAPASHLGAPHCIELPFLLGEPEAWAAAPMLAGASWHEIDSLGAGLRAAWASFARGDGPGDAWRACSDADQPLNILPMRDKGRNP